MNDHIHIASLQAEALPLAQALPRYKNSVVIRLGGHHEYNHEIQINSRTSILNSIDKLKQKTLLINKGCKTLPMLEQPVFPCVVKGKVRSCGTHVIVCYNEQDYNKAVGKMVACKGHIIEPLFHSTGEYRLHCTREEVFFAVKKIKRDPNDIIINHKNHYNVREFVKPRLWKEMQAACLKAMRVLDLDIACFDVMYNSSNNLEHDFNIAEANTNPELLHNTFVAYTAALDKLIKQKIAALPRVFDQMPRHFPDNVMYNALKAQWEAGNITDKVIQALVNSLQ